jgi:hypothetical protein
MRLKFSGTSSLALIAAAAATLALGAPAFAHGGAGGGGGAGMGNRNTGGGSSAAAIADAAGKPGATPAAGVTNMRGVRSFPGGGGDGYGLSPSTTEAIAQVNDYLSKVH